MYWVSYSANIKAALYIFTSRRYVHTYAIVPCWVKKLGGYFLDVYKNYIFLKLHPILIIFC